jgi:membrane protein DedA with SNARE-associated domain
MRLLIVAMLLVSWDVQGWMQHAFYPVLALVLLAASFGVPIPEDVPLIAAGVILAQQPGTATWTGTLCTALLGIMCGDVVLYTLGKRWGPEACQHRWINWLMTPARLEKMTRKFSRYGMWMCFFARFIMGVRAAMCITAGVTRFPFWRFLAADLAGAVLSIPLLIWLGYWFANMVPTLKTYVHLVQWGLLAIAIVILAGSITYWRRRARKAAAQADPAPPVRVVAHQIAPLESVSPPKQARQPGNPPRKPETCL